MPHIGSETLRTIARELVESLASEGWSDAQKGRVMRQFTKVMSKHLRVLTVDIAEFHEKFGLAYGGSPRILPQDIYELRSKRLHEEVREYDEAYAARDLHGQFDALIDLAYILLGTSHLQGLPFAAGWARVHEANMAKVRVARAEDSKHGSPFDIVKPPGWKPPDLNDLLPPPSTSIQGGLF